MAISRVDFWYLIIESVTRNPNLGIPALEDGLFANVLIFDYLYHTYTPSCSSSQGAAPPGPFARADGRTGGRADGAPFSDALCFFVFLYGPWEVSHFFRRETLREMH